MERAHDLLTSLSTEVFPGALQTEQKTRGWREDLENEVNLKHSGGYLRPTGSKYLVESSSAPYYNSEYSHTIVVLDARTQQVLIDQLFSVPKCGKWVNMSESSYYSLMMINRAIPERFKCKLSKRTQDIVGEKFMKFSEGNASYRRRMQLEH